MLRNSWTIPVDHKFIISLKLTIKTAVQSPFRLVMDASKGSKECISLNDCISDEASFCVLDDFLSYANLVYRNKGGFFSSKGFSTA